MNRREYLAQLASLLQALPEDERLDALNFYENYLDEAGIGPEDPVPDTVESPQQAAANLRSDLQGGAFTDAGYESGAGAPADALTLSKADAALKKDPARGWKLALIITLAVFLSPIWLGLGAALLGVLAGVFAVIVAVSVTAGALVICGLGVVVLGIVQLVGGGVTLGLGLLGAGLLMVCVGWLLVWLSVLCWGKALPACCRGIAHRIHRKKENRKAAMA